MVREEASQQGFDINNIEVREGEDYFYKPAHLIITNVINAEKKCELLTALEQIKFTRKKIEVTRFFKKLYCT